MVRKKGKESSTIKRSLRSVKKKSHVVKKAAARKRKPRYVYYFLPGKVSGNAGMKILLGGKGANLAEMAHLGISVPPGFTITTQVCKYYFDSRGRYPKGLREQVEKAIREVERVIGRRFGDKENPLLFSVRSGAPASMPGMMDTILNLGLNDEIVEGLVKQTGDERFAYDAYRRFITMYADVVLDRVVDPLKGIKKYEFRKHFEELIEEKKSHRGCRFDYELSAEDWKQLVGRYKDFIEEKMGRPFPSNPVHQLWGAIGAVFGSWNNPRAIEYRRMNNIPPDWGTAANVQAMVFGNMGRDSATGVAFTRNPATGEARFFGEWLPNAQGEDVVAGIRTPYKLDRETGGESSLEVLMPGVYKQLVKYLKIIEKHFKDMQDIEFTIENGKLWILQTRAGKRTAIAAMAMAVSMVKERLITKQEALMRIEPEQLNHLLRPVFNQEAKDRALKEGRLLAKGLPAGPGAASGVVALDPAKAIEEGAKNPVILVRSETSPEDIHGMRVAEGILTQKGGMTSHAALVGRQMGKVCVVGCEEISIDYVKRTVKAGGREIKEGEYISLDGTKGEVIAGKIETRPSEVIQVLVEGSLKPESAPGYQIFAQIMKWADSIRRLKVRTNADTPQQARISVAFGAEGIGLCRTEHMFFGEEKIDAMREMIVAPDENKRREALSKLLPYQKRDFVGIFKAMDGRPVTIRTLDPPLHEFLPREKSKIEQLAQKMGISTEFLRNKVEELKEFNPMLGHRGCRLTITYPEIVEMQARAIFSAAIECYKQGIKVKPEIMIPLVGDVKELELQKHVVDKVASELFNSEGVKIPYTVGTMIEIPRAAITADKIAEEADFFSFGTNDLTQTTYGISRDDSGSFLNKYLSAGIFKTDPFQSIDIKGVGELMKFAVEKGRKTKPGLKIGICGEHGGEPNSVEFCHRIGLNYVSCSPYRLPVARLAAARAVILEQLLGGLEKKERK